MITDIAPGVVQIDTQLGGWSEVTAVYLVEGENPVLIETGAQKSSEIVIDALRERGLKIDAPLSIAVTHIHIDHAGGVGDIVRAFPNANVYAHKFGARHLVDTTKLMTSARQVFGELIDTLYGEVAAAPAERVHVIHDLEFINVEGERRVIAISTPGHAKHHLAFYDTGSGIIFVGDAVGVRLPECGVLRPAAPPPDFDLQLALTSLKTIAAWAPTATALAHFGVAPDPLGILGDAGSQLMEWVSVARAAREQGEDVFESLNYLYGYDNVGIGEPFREIMEKLNGMRANVDGIVRYLETSVIF